MTPPDLLLAWETMLAALGEPAWIVAPGTLAVRAINAAACALLGITADEALARGADTLIAAPEDLAYWDEVRDEVRDEVQDEVRDAVPKAAQPTPAGLMESEAVLVDASGKLVHVTRRICPLAAAAVGQPPHRLVTVRDRSAERRAADAKDELVAELQATLDSTGDGILVTDLAGRIRGFNQRFAEIWGLPENLLTERQDEAVFGWMQRSVTEPEAYARRLDALSRATLAQGDERIRLLSGRVLERVTRPQCTHGRPVGRVWAFRDRTDIEEAGQRIEALATTDALTGLANRRRFSEQLGLALQHAVAVGQGSGLDGQPAPLALLLLDLDRFRQINDSLGAAVGDRVLRDIAETLRQRLRDGDTLARLGGDQFALLVHGADTAAAERTARRMLEAVSRPRIVQGMPFTLTASIGVALFPQDGQEAESLLRHAEGAMRQAKVGGRAGYRLHRTHALDDGEADLRQRLRLDHAMRQALASQRFRLHYQPQVALATGRIVGAEALIRWRDPELGEVSPGQFIPVAEETGFIIAIGDWVLAQAVRQTAAWRDAGIPVPVSINVSALQFQQARFVDRVAAVLAEHKVPGAMIELELTESILVHDADDALARLAQLSRLGVRLAIDDFGTGYSSLAYLKRFPIERLKIDRSFVKGVPGDDSDAAIVRAVVQLARAMDMKVIAEGVETEPQRAFLTEIGCDEFQGFLYAPALDPAAFEERLRGAPPRVPKRPRLTLVTTR